MIRWAVSLPLRLIDAVSARRSPTGVQDDLVLISSLQSQFACERFAFSPAM